MIKNQTVLEVKSGERVYKFLCEMDSPLGEVFDVLSQMKNFVIQRINESNQPPVEEAKPSENEEQ